METIQKFKEYLEDTKIILITTHQQPDADGIGSQIALTHALQSIGKKVVCVNEEKLTKRHQYLDLNEIIIPYNKYMRSDAPKEFDLFIVVDTNTTDRIGTNMKKLSIKSNRILFIDHHPCPKEVISLHCIDINKCATGEIIGKLIEGLGIAFTKQMALPLYSSILVDSSSFRYPKVSSGTHRLVASLMETGEIRPSWAYNQICGTKKISHIQLLGRVLSTAQTDRNGVIAWITMSEEELKKFKVDQDETNAFINHLLNLG